MARIRDAFSASHIKRPKRITANPKWDLEDEEIQALLAQCDWDRLPSPFLEASSAFFRMTQDGVDYFLPGILLGCLGELREGRDLLETMCIYRSVAEWRQTLERYSSAQRDVLHDCIRYIRAIDSEFWINTSIDEAFRLLIP